MTPLPKPDVSKVPRWYLLEVKSDLEDAAVDLGIAMESSTSHRALVLAEARFQKVTEQMDWLLSQEVENG